MPSLPEALAYACTVTEMLITDMTGITTRADIDLARKTLARSADVGLLAEYDPPSPGEIDMLARVVAIGHRYLVNETNQTDADRAVVERIGDFPTEAVQWWFAHRQALIDSADLPVWDGKASAEEFVREVLDWLMVHHDRPDRVELAVAALMPAVTQPAAVTAIHGAGDQLRP